MIYEKDKIKRLIEYKDTIIEGTIKNDLEWILACYNEYFINSKEYEIKVNDYKNVLNKYYDAEDEKDLLKQQLYTLKSKYKEMKDNCNGSCKKNKNMV